MSAINGATETTAPPGSALETLRVFLKLGLTSFGGPVAHLGYFRAEFVERRKWLDEAHYLDIVALCQFLPGPANSQVGITVGILRAGLPGALAAWVGFSGGHIFPIERVFECASSPVPIASVPIAARNRGRPIGGRHQTSCWCGWRRFGAGTEGLSAATDSRSFPAAQGGPGAFPRGQNRHYGRAGLLWPSQCRLGGSGLRGVQSSITHSRTGEGRREGGQSVAGLGCGKRWLSGTPPPLTTEISLTSKSVSAPVHRH